MNRRWAAAALAVVGIVFVAACGRESNGTQAVERTVRASVTAENAKDVKSFLALWTDKGLKENDVGSRADLLAGKRKESFGSEPAAIRRFVSTTVMEDHATTTVDVTFKNAQIASAIFRLKLALIKSGDKWLIDGFKFLGSAPPAKGTQVLDIKAREYEFALSTPSVAGNFAMKFTNIGKQQHELTFFKAPDGTDVGTAKHALENVPGDELKPLPAGYKVDHLAFTEPGQSRDVSFADPLEPGTYVFACYVPEGGFGPNGPVNPNGKPHIQLGMVNVLTVT